MFRPVGDQPPSVYWRRRLILVGSAITILVLLILTVQVVSSGDPTPVAAGSSSRNTAPSPSHPRSSTSARSGDHSPSGSNSDQHSGSKRSSRSASRPASRSAGSSSPPPSMCTASQLSLSAESDKTSYQVGDAPVLSLLVKNSSPTPCVQDLADPQVVLRVYNGESRVWGSHDCKIEPGTDDRTLMAGSSVRVSIVWSGLSSRPNDCNNRQRAGAGTYTLYASLSGHVGTAAQFTIR